MQVLLVIASLPQLIYESIFHNFVITDLVKKLTAYCFKSFFFYYITNIFYIIVLMFFTAISFPILYHGLCYEYHCSDDATAGYVRPDVFSYDYHQGSICYKKSSPVNLTEAFQISGWSGKCY